MTGAEHAPFNAAMLHVLRKVYPEQAIYFYAANSHWAEVQAISTAQKIHFRAYKVTLQKSGKKWQWLKKFINEASHIIRLLRRAKKQHVALVCFSFLSPIGQYLLGMYLSLFHYPIPIIIMLHGLTILKPQQQRKSVDRLYATLLTKSFKRATYAKRYVVLEQSAHYYLLKHTSLTADKLFFVPHPYLFKSVVQHIQAKQFPIQMGHLGVARLDKRSDLFFSLAAHFQQSVTDGKIAFQVVGSILPEMRPFLSPWVISYGHEHMLHRGEYERMCQALDYAVFCYPAEAYELTSSGAVLDAIAFHKPIFALRTPQFEQLFSRSPTPPGMLFDDMETMKTTIMSLLESTNVKPDYDRAFVHLKHYYSVEHVADLWKKALA